MKPHGGLDLFEGLQRLVKHQREELAKSEDQAEMAQETADEEKEDTTTLPLHRWKGVMRTTLEL